MNPADYGLTDDVTETVETVGAALTPEPKRRGPRATMLSDAQKALDAGQPIPFVALGSAQNPAATDKAWKLWGFYAGTDAQSLTNFMIGGSNTYAKALRSYRAILLESTTAGIEPSGEMINDLQTEWDAKLAEKAAIKDAAKAERKAAKPAKVKADKPVTAEQAAFNERVAHATGDHAETSSEDLEKQAAGLDEKVRQLRKDKAPTAEIDDLRIGAKVLRKVASNRLTPADKAASKAVADKLKAAAQPKAKPAGDPKLIARSGNVPAKTAKVAEVAPKIDVFASKTAAVAAARKSIGDDAVEGVDFKISGKGKRLSWLPIGNAAPAA